MSVEYKSQFMGSLNDIFCISLKNVLKVLKQKWIIQIEYFSQIFTYVSWKENGFF